MERTEEIHNIQEVNHSVVFQICFIRRRGKGILSLQHLKAGMSLGLKLAAAPLTPTSGNSVSLPTHPTSRQI